MGASVAKSGGQILDRPSPGVANANTSYVYFLCKFGDGKTVKALHWKPTATTVTLEFTNDNPTVLATSATATQLAALEWEDLTNLLTGSASHTTEGTHTFDEDFGWFLGRVKLVTTNATNAADLFLNRG